MLVWEAKIKLAEDVANVGSWNLVGCHATLAELKGKLIKTSEDPEGQQPKADDEKKISGNDDQATV